MLQINKLGLKMMNKRVLSFQKKSLSLNLDQDPTMDLRVIHSQI